MDNGELFERGQKVLPGGVCSSTRLNQGLGYPVYVQSAEGARFTCPVRQHDVS